MATLKNLTTTQKRRVGRKVTALVRAERPADPVALGLCGKIGVCVQDLSRTKTRGQTALTERHTKVKEVKAGDRLRDRAVKSFNLNLRSWELRDDQPDAQAAAKRLRRLMLSKGTGFTNFGYEDESEEIGDLLALRTDEEVGPAVTEAVGQVPLIEGFITNLENSQADFEGVAEEKQTFHGTTKEQTKLRDRAEVKWENSMSALLKHLEGEYDDEAGRAVLVKLLQPLNEALVLAQRRATLRAAGNEAGAVAEEAKEDAEEDAEAAAETSAEPEAAPAAGAVPPADDPEPH